jgi:hypothetical protein
MTGFVSRKAQDPTTWFVSSSYLIHFGVLVSAFYAGDGMNPLLNPAGIVMVSFGAAYSATAGPPIHRATGSLWTASWQTIGVPFAIVGVGIPTAIAIEATDHSPIIRAMLFAPWWTLFIAVTLWQHASGKKAEHPPGSSVFGVVGTRLFLAAIVAFMGLLTALISVISLTP